MAKSTTSGTMGNDRGGATTGSAGAAGSTVMSNPGTPGSTVSTSRSGGLRGRASGVTQSASQQINSSPFIAVGAGAALGAVLGAVLPASRKEKELLRPLGTKITDAGFGAVDRARNMGKQKFDEMAGDKVREFLGMGSGSSSNSGSGSDA